MEIKVVNKRTHTPTSRDYYIGRPSALGNPFTHLSISTRAQIKVETREEAIEKYKEWIKVKIKEQDPDIINELSQIIKKAENGGVNLVCWCHPKPCHGHILKKILDNYFTIQEK
jgi:hypothetical protein